LEKNEIICRKNALKTAELCR